MPKTTKYSKYQKGYYPEGISSKGNSVHFGSFGLKSIEAGKLNANQIESCRRLIMRYTKRLSKLYIRVFPDLPVTKKPVEVRMGKGKGSVDHWICKIEKGRVIFELDKIDYLQAKMVFSQVQQKLPFKTKFVAKLQII